MDPFETPTTFFALFSAVMSIITATLVWFIKGVRTDQRNIVVTLENHLGSVAKSLTIVEERLSRADRLAETLIPIFFGLKNGVDLIQSALIQSTIVPPGTRVTVESFPRVNNIPTVEIKSNQ